MSGFLYFIPNANANDISLETVSKKAMAYAFEKRDSVTKVGVDNGPGGMPGMLFSSANRVIAARNRYNAATQEWVECKRLGYWVGMYKEEKPLPEDLQRSKVLPSMPVELGDGNLWMIPQARRWNASEDNEEFGKYSVPLPRVISWNGDDTFVYGRVVSDYSQLWNIAEACWNYRHDGPTADEYITTPAQRESMEGSQFLYSVIAVLQANYVIGPAEAMMLELLHQGTGEAVMDALLDWRNWELVCKKKESLLTDGQSS